MSDAQAVVDHEVGEDGLETLAKRLEASDEFRVLRKFRVGDSFGHLEGEKTGVVCVLDFETTGVEESDRPIEIGMLRIEYCRETGRLGKILSRYQGLEDPGFELPENIVALTGITDAMVAGKRFDDDTVRVMVEQSSVVVAHNAEFDRGFGERRFECMQNKPWACSFRDVPWAMGDIGSGKLEFIAMKMGWFYGAHRAIDDCEVTAGVLSKELCAGQTAMKFLLDKARRRHYRVWATGSPYKTKNMLSGRGYSWRNVPGCEDKAWMIETMDPNEEVEWLRDCVYRKGGSVLLEEVGAVNRFTPRSERVDVVAM